MEYPFVSVVIPTYNRKDLLEKCLQSVAAQTYPKDRFEVIVVDDGSTDGTTEMLDSLITALPYTLKYQWQSNQGVSKARNTGLKESRGEVIAFTSNDVTVDKNWIKAAQKYFEDPAVGGVEGKVVATEKEKITPFTHQTESIKERMFLAANIFYRRDVLTEIGGFDERFNKHIREDSDLAFGVLEKGWEIAFAKDAIINHPTYYSKHWGLFKEARNGFVEPLLYKKHKKLMNNFRHYNIDRRSIAAIPYYYYGYYLAPIGAVFCYLLNINLFFSLSLFVISFLVTVYAKCRNKNVSLKDLLIVSLAYTAIPYARIYYIIKGCIYYRSFVFL